MVSKFTESTKPKTIEFVNGSTITEYRANPGPLPQIKAMSTDETKTNSPTQYVYQYGLKNIGLSHSLYQDTGIFVTKPIDVEGNIVEVSLATSEEHPLFNELDGMATDRVTSIEYYISLEENPSLNDWVPLLPEGTNSVKTEKLFFQGSSASLRFHADINNEGETRVYRNNIAIAEEEWYFTERGAAVQLAGAVDKNASYTIDYVPNSALYNPWNIKVGDRFSKRIRQVDEFPNGADYNNTIKLSKYPFVNYEIVNGVESYDPNNNDYRPIDVFVKEGNMVTASGSTQSEFYPEAYTIGGEFVTRNRTDYKNSKDVFLNRYSIVQNAVNHAIEYKQEKNKLVFTESFNRSDMYYNEASNHGNAKIVIHYDYLVTNFRLKVILRKNTGDELVVTPTVNSYQLKFKVMK